MRYNARKGRGNGDMELTACESIVLDAMRAVDQDMTMPEITETVNLLYNKNWSKRAVSAFLARLRKKKAIVRYRRDHNLLYHPLRSQKQRAYQIE